jgi:predicted transcriptional regulator
MAKRERKAYTVQEREVQVLGAIAVNVQSGGSWWLTAADIAKRLKMTPSTHLRLILANMVTTGQLDARKETDPGIAGFRRLYTVPDNDYRKAIKSARQYAHMDEKRSIRVNSRQMSFDMEVFS